jgi:hypothetical protein
MNKSKNMDTMQYHWANNRRHTCKSMGANNSMDKGYAHGRHAVIASTSATAGSPSTARTLSIAGRLTNEYVEKIYLKS